LQVVAQLRGDQKLPWEQPNAPKLDATVGGIVLRLVEREPSHRLAVKKFRDELDRLLQPSTQTTSLTSTVGAPSGEKALE
jgi:hypothetical protein